MNKVEKFLLYCFIVLFSFSFLYNSYKNNTKCIEIYTFEDILYIYPNLMKIEFESTENILYFNSFETMKDWIANKTADNTSYMLENQKEIIY